MLVKRTSLVDELERSLSESRESALERERRTFDELASPFERSLVLFGAGNLGRKTLAGLRRAGIEPLAFADNDERLWGTRVAGLEVLAPAEAARRHRDDATFVVTIWRGEGTDRMPQRVRQLEELGCRRVVPFTPLFWKLADVFLPHYAVDLPHHVLDRAHEVRAAFDLFEDEPSRAEFVAQIRWRANLDFDLPDPVAHEIYFPDDLFTLTEDEVFVDCGAFDGDTIRRFLKRRAPFSGEIHAFEPDPSNFERLERYVAGLPEPLRHRITPRRAAVGARRETVRFDATGTESASVGSGSLEVSSVPLDEELLGSSPTYIKMDTEGSEPDAISGARDLIARHAPALAICVYHRQSHLWEVPNLLRSCSDRYRYFLRPQLLEGWDLVCYAVPASRLEGSAAR